MPIQRTLLERIRYAEEYDQRHAHVSWSEVFDSILNNLQNMLNTCRGNCLTDPLYGLPHTTEIRNAMPHSIAPFEAAIRATIERHEPRLSNVRVKHVPSTDRGMELRFEISGIIQDEDGRQSVRFETYADEHGRLVVR